MNTRAFTLALAIAGIAMFLVYTYMEDQKANLIRRYGNEKPVIVAAKDIRALELLDISKLSLKPMPASFIHSKTFTDPSALLNTVATVPIFQGEVITKPRVTYPGARTGLSRQISVGKRAIALQVTQQQAASKLIKPGDRVDVLAAIEYNPSRDKRMVKTIIQDVLVLSTGFNMTNNLPLVGMKSADEKIIRKMNVDVYSRYNTITLELTPFEVQKLVYLLSYGAAPYLTLRNNNDKEQLRIGSTGIYDFLENTEKLDAKKFFINRNKN